MIKTGSAILLAVFAATAAGSLAIFLWFVFGSWPNLLSPQPLTSTDWQVLGSLFFVLAPFALGTLLIFGIPVTLVLAKYQLERSWTYPVLGGVIGFVIALIFATPIWGPYTDRVFVFQLLGGGLPGSVAGIIWWNAFRRGRTLPGSVR